MRILVFALLFLMSVPVLCAELPVPAALGQDSPSTKGMVWNKWETDNFILLSIDFGFGKKLKSSLESSKSGFCESWGLFDKPLPVKCKVVCVPDPSLLKRFFSLDRPRCEVRTDESKSVTELAIWIDEERSSELPGLIAAACLHGQPAFLSKGIPKIVSLSAVEMSELILSSGSSPAAAFRSGDPSDSDSVVACLFLRKEFGSLVLSRVVSEGLPPEKACGFVDEKSLELTLKRYCDNLKSDLESGKTPDSYLKP